MAIPKIIHYCWFGRGKKSQLILDCMESWKKFLPDYEIIEWNEDNFDISSNMFVKEAYKAKKWAFVSDYVRLYALYKMGGIYLDTDVEVFKSLDRFLDDRGFSGFESRDCIPTAVMGSESGLPAIAYLLSYYDDRHFLLPDGSSDTTTNVTIITNMFLKKGLLQNGRTQTLMDFTFYSQKFFIPNSVVMIFGRFPKFAYTYHHMTSSWKESSSVRNIRYRLKHYLVGKARNLIGTDRLESIRDGKRSDV